MTFNFGNTSFGTPTTSTVPTFNFEPAAGTQQKGNNFGATYVHITRKIAYY